MAGIGFRVEIGQLRDICIWKQCEFKKECFYELVIENVEVDDARFVPMERWALVRLPERTPSKL